MGLELVLDTGVPGEPKIRTNPGRDIAHFWPQIVSLIPQGLALEVQEPWFRDYLVFKGVTEDQLFLACACFQDFLVLALEPDVKTPLEAIQRSGFLNCPVAAQLVILGKLGQLATGAFWAGIRSASPANTKPASVERLAKSAARMKQILDAQWKGKPGAA